MHTEVVTGVKMVFFQCPTCAVQMGIPDVLDDKYRRTHEEFYCPNGHGQSYKQKTDEEQLREKLHAERVKVMNLEEEQRRAQHVVRSGKCPVKGCGQHLRDLDRHMKRKHRK